MMCSRSCEKLATYFGRPLEEVLAVSGRRQARAPNPRNLAFGGWLVERMRALGIGTGALARRLGLSETTIYNWRQGTRTPDPIHCRSLAEALGLPAREVLERAGYGAN